MTVRIVPTILMEMGMRKSLMQMRTVTMHLIFKPSSHRSSFTVPNCGSLITLIDYLGNDHAKRLMYNLWPAPILSDLDTASSATDVPLIDILRQQVGFKKIIPCHADIFELHAKNWNTGVVVI